MASFSLSNLSPEVLKWARENSGLTLSQAAERIGVDQDLLAKWESEIGEIPYGKIRKMAEHYKVTTPILFLQVPPEYVKGVVDRRRAQELKPEYIREEKLAIKRAYDKHLIFVEAAGILKTELPIFEQDFSKISTYASQIRELLGVTLEDQSKFKDSYEAFNTWKGRIEAKGVLVFQESFHQLSGFTLSARDPGLIFLNSSDNVKRRIFTLMHELGHLLLNDGSISDVKDYDGDGDKTEVFCNKFAAEILVPREVLKRVVASSFTDGEEINFRRVITLSNRFSVSAKMMLVRLKATNLVTPENFDLIARDISRRNDEKDKKSNNEPPKIPYYIRYGSKVSRTYAKEVLRSYDSGKSSLFSTLSHLRLGSTHLANLRSYLGV